MCGYVWVCAVSTGVCGSVRVSASVCVLDEFSEYLLETRVNTSADFNMYPIQIFQVVKTFKGWRHYVPSFFEHVL